MASYHILSLSKELGVIKSVINPVLIETSDGLILFDAGYPGQGADFKNALGQAGFSVSDINRIVISHHDHDHIGSLCELKGMNPEIKIIASEIEAKYISGKEKSMRLAQAEKFNESLSGSNKAFGEQFAQYLKTINTCCVDRFVRDGDYVGDGVRVIETPGHTPGHISLYIEQENILLAGDALAVENEKLVVANPQFTLDMVETLRSIEKIRNMNPAGIICYHGGAIAGSVNENLSCLLTKI